MCLRPLAHSFTRTQQCAFRHRCDGWLFIVLYIRANVCAIKFCALTID